MKISCAFGKIAAVLSVGLIAATADAGFWEWTRPFKGPGRHVTTLVITGNYKRPLALAQLMRAENRQPYLLIPAQESGLKDVFFCPVNDRTPGLKINAKDISRFVRLLNPRKVIVLGDTRYVPESYIPQLDGRIPIVRVDCDDWNRNAEMLGKMLNLNSLESDYKRIGEKFDRDMLYKPLPAKPVAAAPVKEEPKAEAPATVAPAGMPAAEVDPADGKVLPAGEVKNDNAAEKAPAAEAVKADK